MNKFVNFLKGFITINPFGCRINIKLPSSDAEAIKND